MWLATTALVCTASPALAQQAAAVSLETILVESENSDTSDTYTTGDVTIGGKLDAPLREIPQAVSVVTQERIDDQNMTELQDAAKTTPGLRVFRNDPGRASIFSRGFEFDSYYVDGLSAPLASAYGSGPDLAPFERVEFLKGPSALFAGSSEPGGLVNMVRKRGLDAFALEATARYGSWQDGRGEIDVGGPFNAEKTIRGRAVLAYQDANSFVDFNDAELGLAYGNVDIDVTENTTLSAAVWHQARDLTPSNALPTNADGSFLDLDRSTYLGADWNWFEQDSTDAIVELEHRFDDGGHARVAGRYSERAFDSEYAFTAGSPSATGDVLMRGLSFAGTERSLFVDAHVSKPFEAFGQSHNVMVGVDYDDQTLETHQGAAVGFAVNNVFAPRPAMPKPTLAYTRETKSDPAETGIYGQLRVKPFEPLTVVLGGRAAWYEADVTDLATGTTTNISHDGETTPYAGVIYDLNEYLSAYASYTEVFQPQTELDAAGNVLPVRTAEQVEIGLKASLFDGAVNASLAAYRLEDVNRAIADPALRGTYMATGVIEVDGFEAELSGSPLPGWDVFAGYTYLDMEYAADSATLSYRYYLPKHQFTLWTKYTFESGALEGFHLAGGLNVVSEFHNVYNGVEISEDGYATVDAQIGYRFTENLSGTLTVTNLFDEVYYERLGTTATFNFHGAPRAVMAELKASF